MSKSMHLKRHCLIVKLSINLRQAQPSEQPYTRFETLDKVIVERKETYMHVAKISEKFQVIIPTAIRKKLDIKPGQHVQVIQNGDRIELIPVQSIRSLRGFVRGIDTDVPREGDRV